MISGILRLSYWLPIVLLIISNQVLADHFNVKSKAQLAETLNWDAKQCASRLPEETSRVLQLFQTGQQLEDSHFYYLMTRMGINHQEFFYQQPDIIHLLESPETNKNQIIRSLSHRFADSLVDAVEATRYRFSKEVLDSFNLSMNFDDYIVSTHEERAELFFGNPGPLLLTTKALGAHCQSIVELLQLSRQKDLTNARVDTIATGNYMIKATGITREHYEQWREDFFASDRLFDRNAESFRQLATFISYLLVRNQFSWLKNNLSDCSGVNDDSQSCTPLMQTVTQFSGSVSERLVHITSDWLTDPKQIQPCFNAGCYGWYAWIFHAVQDVQKTADTPEAQSITKALTPNNQNLFTGMN